ncbi:MAG: FAD-binding oxidoreductase [candidate division Zixibacteria bacterium]|nr:FAD-binding oxidoreductase [candidate division Zixibacteria bacterium]
MIKKADVVIIGGGIIGLATAFNLAKLKYGKILVIEKELFLGAGSTGKCAGGVRAQFSNKVNIEMSMKSEEILVNFEKEVGYPIVFDQVGYMFLLSNERELAEFTKAIELQRSLGLKVDLLEPAEISKIAPPVRTDDIIKATFCKADGLADPSDLIQGYASAARKLGVEIAVETEAIGLKTRNGAITAVTTNQGEISTPLVVNAAGPYAGIIGQMAGAKVPGEPVRRQIVTTGPLDYIPATFPMVVDVQAGLYFHKESAGLLLGWADKAVKPGFDISVDPEYTDTILNKALERVPKLETAEISKSWAGLYETTPDHQAIIGFANEIKGMFIAAGFSGHGMMHAPAAGLISAELICGKNTSIDPTPLSPDRFAKGAVSEETNVI